MATLDDKLLGEKLQYYCSSDEENGENSDDNDEFDDAVTGTEVFQAVPEDHHVVSGRSINTGPKGVIKDWQRYKQLETEKREENERERNALAQKFSMTCGLDNELNDDPELADLLSDQFLLEFRQKRMQEMHSKSVAGRKFGKLFHLKTGDEFLDAVDNEVKTVSVILHVFENSNNSCRVMNECFEELSGMYPDIKFCKISASTAGMSRTFKMDGVPAIQIYRGGNLIDSFIQLGEEFGIEFTANDVENFLLEKGIVLDYAIKSNNS